MRRSVLTTIRAHHHTLSLNQPGAYRDQEGHQRFASKWRCALITLTYADIDGYDPRDISETLSRIRKYMQRRGIPFRYVWVMELQKRGAPHYHLITWLPWGMKLPKIDVQGWWTKGHTNMKWRRSPFYVMKYVSKLADSGTNPHAAWAFPKASRISGQGGLSHNGKVQRRWYTAPSWLRKALKHACQDVGPSPGGGWTARATGEHFESPYLVWMNPGGVFFALKSEVTSQ